MKQTSGNCNKSICPFFHKCTITYTREMSGQTRADLTLFELPLLSSVDE